MKLGLRLVINTCLIFLCTLSAFSSPVADRDPASPPDQPGGFNHAEVTWTTTSTMLLNWLDSLPGITGYSVYDSTKASVFTKYADVGAGITSYAATHLLNNTRYYWKIIAHLPAGNDTSLIFSDSTHCNMSGVFTVGPQGYFHSIGSALDSLPLKGMTGNVVLELQNGYSSSVESFPLLVPGTVPCRQQNYSLTLRPAAGTSGITLSNNTQSPLLILDNTFNVIIDGRPGGAGSLQGLTLSAPGQVIDCRNSSNNSFIYLVVQASTPNFPGSLITLEGTAGSGSNNNTISWCNISGLTSARPHTLIYSFGSTGIANTRNSVVNCNLHDFSAMGISLAAGNNGWSIKNNSFYASYGYYTDTTTAGMIGIADTDHPLTDSIADNYFGGTLPQCGGTVMNVLFKDVFEIIAAAGNADIRNNSIQRISFAKLTQGNTFYPSLNIIRVGAQPFYAQASYTIVTNTIGGVAAADSISMSNYSTILLPATLITQQSASNSLTVSGNKMQNLWMQNAGGGASGVSLTGINMAGGTNTVTDNIIGDGAGAPGIANFTGEGILGISDYAYNIQLKNNRLTGWTGQKVITGITAGSNLDASGGIMNISQNTIGRLSTPFTNPDGTSSYGIVGLFTNKAWGGLISGNTIYALRAPAGVVGLGSTNGDPAQHIDGNFIHPTQRNGAADSILDGTVTGIYLTGDQSLVQNNMIKLGPDSSGSPIHDQASFYGIQLGGSDNEIRNNSVYIDGKGVLPGLNSSACITFFTQSYSHVYNNIFVNRRSAAVAGNSSFHYVLWNPGGGIEQIDNNIYYSEGTNSIFSSWYGYPNGFLKLGDWRVRTGFDQHSIFVDPGFVNPGGSSAFLDLHLLPVNAAEGKGDTTRPASTDFDGQLRAGLTPVDIGADAGNFTLRDAWPPVLTPDSIPNHPITAPQTTTVRIIDDSGIDSTAGAGPAMWFRKFSPFPGDWLHVTGMLVSGNAKKGVWKFTADYSTFGLTVNAGDSFQCYFAAQDTTTLHNIGFAPLVNANQLHPGIQDTLPANWYKYTVRGVLPDTLLVGTGQPYTSLTNTGGAFQALNTATPSDRGAVIVITSDLAETGAIALSGYNNDTTHKSPLQIITNTPVLKTITNSTVINATGGMIQFVKSRNIIIDGAVGNTGKYLKFVNTNVNASSLRPCLYFDDGASDIVIRHSIVGADDRGNYSSSAAIGIAFVQNNSNVLIDSNLIGNGTTAGNTTTLGIYASNKVSGLRITNNEFFNFTRAGIELRIVGDSCSIQNNHFYYNARPTAGYQYRSGINVNGFVAAGEIATGGHIISGNYIGGSSAYCGGAPWPFTGSPSANPVLQGIFVESATDRTSYVYNNVVENISMGDSYPASFYGINTYGKVDVGGRGGNMIGNPAVPGDITNAGVNPGSGLSTMGIQVYFSNASSVTNNTISNLAATGAGNMTVAGIGCVSDNGGVTVIKNNTIRQLSSAGTQSPNNLAFATPYSVAGIALRLGRYGYIVEHNDIAFLQSTAAGTLTAGILDLSMRCPVTITRNRIHDLVNQASTGGELAGIRVNGNAHQVTNNQITVINGTNTNTVLLSGIKDSTAAGNGLPQGSRYYYNSVFVGGTVSTGSLSSFAANFQTNAPIADFRNNVLYNARSGGTGAHLALGVNTPVNAGQQWPAGASDFNMLITRDTAVLALWQGSTILNLPSLRATSGGDVSSYSLPLSAIPANTLFIDAAGGNLDINIANSQSWALNGKGIPVDSISGDFDSSINARSTSIATGATDIGSDEFTPVGPPSPTTIGGDHRPGGSDTLSVNGRTTAILTWDNTGSLPSLGTAAWYSGVWPNDTTNNGQAFMASYMNSYWVIPAIGGNSYSYNITLFYDSAMLGKIGNISRMVINKREPNVPGSWIQLKSTVDTLRRTITATGLSSFSEFTVTDSLADLQTGLHTPELIINGLQLDSTHVSGGSAVSAKFTVGNGGNATAPTDTAYFYLCTDTVLRPGSAGTSLLGVYPVTGNLVPGASSAPANVPLLISCTTVPGAYYLFVQADGGHKILQAGNSSHAAWVALTVTAAPPIPGKPVISASPSLTACVPDSVLLKIDPTTCTSCVYTWSNGLSGTTDLIKVAGAYSVTATTVCGKTVSDAVTVSFVSPATPSVDLSYTGCNSGVLTFLAKVVNGGAHPIFKWKVNGIDIPSTTDTLMINDPINGTRVVCTVTSAASCVNPASVSDSLDVQCVSTSNTGIDGLALLQVAPVPTAGPVTIHLRLDQEKKVGYTLLDKEGRVALTMTPVSMTGDQTLKVDLSRYSSGIYYLRFVFDGQPLVRKILVIR